MTKLLSTPINLNPLSLNNDILIILRVLTITFHMDIYFKLAILLYIKYLLMDDLDGNEPEEDSNVQSLLKYSVGYWPDHFRKMSFVIRLRTGRTIKSIVCLYLYHRKQSLRSLCLAHHTRNSAHRPGHHRLSRHGIIVPDLGFPFERITISTSLLQL